MMNKRYATLLAPKDVGASGTEIIDINLKDSISVLYLKFKFTVATASTFLKNPRETITKIEVMDGSKIIKSMTGQEASAAYFSSVGKMPYSKYSMTVGEECSFIIPINFGRFLWDGELALRPEMFDNLQVRVSYVEDAANANVAVNSLALYAAVFTDSAGKSPMGYFRTLMHQNYTRVASAHEYIDLPVDHAIRHLVIVGAMTNYSIADLIENLKMSINGDAEVPYDLPGAVVAEMLNLNQEFVQNITLDGAVTAKTIFSDFGEDNQLKVSYDGTAFVTAQTKFAEITEAEGSKILAAASVDIKADRAVITGRLPFNGIPFAFGDTYDPSTWLIPSSNDKMRLDIQANAVDPEIDTVSVLIEQIVQY